MINILRTVVIFIYLNISLLLLTFPYILVSMLIYKKTFLYLEEIFSAMFLTVLIYMLLFNILDFFLSFSTKKHLASAQKLTNINELTHMYSWFEEVNPNNSIPN